MEAFFFTITSKFWPRLVVLLKALNNCSEIVLTIVLVSIMSIIFIILALCGTVLIFISAQSVFITTERPAMKLHMK